MAAGAASPDLTPAEKQQAALDGLGKDGALLFRELKRLLPGVEVEDYFRNGRWTKERMVIDAKLLAAHRDEAGAQEPLQV